MRDFPAAHSMDTIWFAIDSEGNVAMFESGESGCVPADAYLGEDFGEVTEKLEELPVTGAVYDLAGMRAATEIDHVPDPFAECDMIAFVRDATPLSDLLARPGVEQLAATSGAALRLRGDDQAVFHELHARDACLGCFFLRNTGEVDLAARGVYRYDNSSGWIAGPYACAAVPAHPITGDALAGVDKVARFAGRFADTPKLQPAELWPCESWESCWLATDGKTVRPFAGREAEYHEAIAELRDLEPSLVFLDTPLPELQPDPPPPRRPWWKFWVS